MRILSAVSKNYYGLSNAVEPMYLEFTDPLRDMGHHVETFDHHSMRTRFGMVGCGERFVERVREGHYDVVLYQTGGGEMMMRDAIAEGANWVPIVAWNSDDDWQWESHTRHLAKHFTFMVTTYPHIYQANKDAHKNLILSQWGCYDRFADFNRRKDLDFTFVGLFYGDRAAHCRALRRHAGLRVFGSGSGVVKHSPLYHSRRLRNLARRIPGLYGRAVDFQEANSIWNRSKISFTPMGASVDPNMLQIKSRAFEMGLSGTLMICEHSPNLELYYEPGKEFVPFYAMDDCIEKVKHYLRHERDRVCIARAYYKRTKAEHLWQHRFAALFREIALCDGRTRRMSFLRQPAYGSGS